MKTLKRMCNCECGIEEVTLRRDETLRYYYHVTSKDWGDRTTLFPRSNGCNRSGDEPDFPRTCFSPRVQLCFVAVGIYSTKYRAYRTARKQRGYYPQNVLDVRMTGERWIVHPVDVIKVWDIPHEVAAKINFLSGDIELGSDDWHQRVAQSRFKSKLLKYLKGIDIPKEVLL